MQNKVIEHLTVWAPIITAAFSGGVLAFFSEDPSVCYIEAAALSTHGNGAIFSLLIIWILTLMSAPAWGQKRFAFPLVIIVLFAFLAHVLFTTNGVIPAQNISSELFTPLSRYSGGSGSVPKGCQAMYSIMEASTIGAVIFYVLGSLAFSWQIEQRDHRSFTMIAFTEED